MSTHLVDDYATVSTSLAKAESDKRIKLLSEIIKLAHAPEEDKLQEAALKLWEFMNNLNDEELADLMTQTSVSGPLAHLLSKFVESKNRNVLLYAARTLKTMMRDDSTREGLCKAGLAKSISLALNTMQHDTHSESLSFATDIKKELYAAAQSILYDKQCAPEFASAGGLRAVGDSISQAFAQEDIERGGADQDSRRCGGDPELRILLLACACNAFSYCDTCLSVYIHEMRNWIEPICHAILKSKIPDVETGFFYVACCLANATRDPGLTHALRAANGAEALDRCRHGHSRTAEVANVALARLQITSGPRSDLERVWRFRWGGGKGSGLRTGEILGLLAFLLVVTAGAGVIILVILHMSKF